MDTLGEILRSERESQGLELKDIENAISIRVVYLNAIEEGNYNVIPGEVYLKGFIRNYANHLGLDAQEILNIYHQGKFPSTGNASIDDNENAKPETPQSGQSTLKAKRLERERERKKKSGSSFSRIAVFIMAIAVVGGVVWWVSGSFINSAPPSGQPENTTSQINAAVPKPEPETAQNQPQAQTQTPLAPESGTAGMTPVGEKEITVAARFKGQCWTQVNIDGKLEYEGIPKIGETLTFNGNQRIFIKFGNAGAVELTHNNKVLGTAGKPGEVIIKTFMKETVSTVNAR